MTKKELSIAERASQALSVDYTEAQLKRLAEKNADVTAINSAEDYQLVKRAGVELGKVRVSIEKAGKSARDDANKFSKAVITEQRRLTGIISPEEDRLKSLRKEVDDAEARKKEAERVAEMARIVGITERIALIKSAAEGFSNASSERISDAISDVHKIECTEELFQEFADRAAEAKQDAISVLEAVLASRKEYEALRAEQERVAKEQAERQADIDRQAEELRKQEEAASAKIEAENAEIRRKQEEAEEIIRSIEANSAAAERAEANRIRQENEQLEAEKREREEAERKQAEDEAEKVRLESLRPEKDRLINWLKSLRFIDGIELNDERLISIQSRVLLKIDLIAKNAISEVEK